MTMTGKLDIWADLVYALDELSGPNVDIRRRLTFMENAFPEYDKLLQIAIRPPSLSYSSARMRANTKNAHEAIEKGLKAILIDSGLPREHMRSRGHQLHRLLADVKQHNPKAFIELERCFDSTIRYLESVTGIQRNTNILEYFRKHGRTEVFVASRYASIEDARNMEWGMIGRVYMEIIHALSFLIFGWTPKDINCRIEEAARKAILAESKRHPVWDAEEWLNRGPVRPRLEVIGNLKNNRVLRAALRRCEKESGDSGIQAWANALRRKHVSTRRRARATGRAG